jgi:AI-2 transport protein TqsA
MRAGLDTVRGVAEPAPATRSALLSLAAFVIVIAGLRAASALVIPLLLAIFVAVIATPALLWLQSRRVPEPVALGLVVAAVAASMLGVGFLLASTVAEFTRALPLYDARLQQISDAWVEQLASFGLVVSRGSVAEVFDPSAAMRLVGNLLTGLGNLLASGFLILLTTVFILLEVSSFPSKLREVAADPGELAQRMDRILDDVQRYMTIKTATSAATGGLLGGALAVIGLDFALVWGMLAFLFNYVPNIGSVIAAIPAVLLALVQLGLWPAIGVTALYLAVNVVIGSVIEPRLVGHRLGLSPLVVLASLIFWGWVLGPIGMLLSVPLTMTAKIGLEANPDTRWIAVLMGPARVG